jgi:Tfp pilus assembly protein PilF
MDDRPPLYDTAGSLNNLAGLYKSQGKYAEAEPLYVRALAILINVLGEKHPDTQTVLSNYAMFLIDREQATKRKLRSTPLQWIRSLLKR